MKTKYVIKGMIKNQIVYFIKLTNEQFFEGKNFEVRKCSTNINEASKYNSYNEALDTIQEYELHNFEPYPICPICGRAYSGYPAISRKDNKTEICSRCGTNEALTIFLFNK